VWYVPRCYCSSVLAPHLTPLIIYAMCSCVGVPSIDVEDWKKHTDFKFFTHNYPTELELNNIEWFWEVINDLKNEDRVRLLQFATGTSRVPAQGFKV
jgi:hypothetical protein